MKYQIGEKVIHPKRPEWGTGEILPGSNESKLRILFSRAGEKKIAPEFISLPKAPDRGPVRNWGQEKRFDMESQTVKNRKGTFDEVFLYKFPPKFKELFENTELVKEWRDHYPFLFDAEDEYLMLQDRKAIRWGFYRWLASVLVFNHSGHRSLQTLRGQVQSPEIRKARRHFKQKLNPELYAALSEYYRRPEDPAYLVILCYSNHLDDYFITVLRPPGVDLTEENKKYLQKLRTLCGRPLKAIKMIQADQWNYWK